jgi:hypothetical protein
MYDLTRTKHDCTVAELFFFNWNTSVTYLLTPWGYWSQTSDGLIM